MTGHVLVLAKAPVAGLVKTRLGRAVGLEAAADLARRSLLDTVEACVAAFGRGRCLLALGGSFADDPANGDLVRAIDGWAVFPQRGSSFAERLVAAHHDAASFVGPALAEGLVQIGMDTPQISVHHLRRLVSASGAGRVGLGPAADGGWWGLAHCDAACVDGLVEVVMSTPETGRLTRAAVERSGYRVVLGPTLRDVDTVDDAHAVASEAPGSRFADGLRHLRTVGR